MIPRLKRNHKVTDIRGRFNVKEDRYNNLLLDAETKAQEKWRVVD